MNSVRPEVQNSDWILVAPQKSQTFSQLLVSVVVYLQRSIKIDNFFNSLSTIALLLQFSFCSLYIASYPFNTIHANYPSLTYVSSVFVHLIPPESTVVTKECAIIFLFSLTSVDLIFLLITFISVKQNIIWHSKITHFLVRLGFCYILIFMPISVNLLTDSVFSLFYGESKVYFSIAIVNFFLEVIGYSMIKFIQSLRISIDKTTGSTWEPIPILGTLLPIIILFPSTEIIVHFGTNNIYVSHTFLTVNILVYLFIGIYILYFMPFILFSTQVFAFLMTLIGFCSTFFIFFIRLFNDVDLIIQILITLLLPCAVLSFYYIKCFTDDFLLKILRMIETEDYSYLEKLNEFKTCIALSLAYHVLDKDLTIFKYAIKYHPKSFLVALHASKIAAIDEKNPDLIGEFLSQMRYLARSLRSWTYLSLFQLVFFDSTQDPHVQSSRMEHLYNSIIDDFLSSLHFFWTEILLGRTSRLSSLAYDANIKFTKATYAFSQLAPKYGKEQCMVESFERFLSFIPIRTTKKPFQNYKIITKILFSNTYTLYNRVNTTSVLSSLNNKSVFSPAASLLQGRNRSKQLLFHHLAIYLPFYFIFGLLITYMVILFSPLTRSRDTLDMYETLMSLLYDISGSYFALSIYIPKSSIIHGPYNMRPYIVGDWIFSSYLSDPPNDIYDLMDDARNRLNAIIGKLEDFQLSDEVMQCLLETNGFYVKVYADIVEQEMSMIPFLNNYILQFTGPTILENPNLLEIFSESYVDLLDTNYLRAVEFITNTIDTLLRVEPILLNSELEDSKKRHISIIVVVAVVVLALSVTFHAILIKIQSETFFPLLSLSKTVISELIEKVGDTIALPSSLIKPLESDERYYIRQLSYPTPPSHYLTNFRLTFNYFIYVLILLTIYVVLFFPVFIIKQNANLEIANSITNSKTLLYLPYVLFEFGSEFLSYEVPIYHNISENIETRRNQVLDLLQQLNLEFSYPLTNLSNMPEIYDSNKYFTEEQCNPSINNTCLSFSNSLSYLLSYSFDSLANEILIEELHMNQSEIDFNSDNSFGVVGNLYFVSSFSFNNIVFPFFKSLQDYYNFSNLVYFALYTGAFVIFFLMMIISKLLRNRLIFPTNFSGAIISSIPLHVLNTNEKILSVISKKKVNSKIGEKLINDPTIFDSISDILLLIDDDDEIAYATPSTSTKLQYDLSDGLETKFTSFMRNICGISFNDNYSTIDYRESSFDSRDTTRDSSEVRDTTSNTNKQAFNTLGININSIDNNIFDRIPPTTTESFPIKITLSESGDSLFVCTLIPVNDFTYNDKQIKFACVLQDATYTNSLILRVNEEETQLHILISQLVPAPVTESLLKEGQFPAYTLDRSCVASFCITGIHSLKVKQISSIHKRIRALLNNYRDLTFIGRSCQHFRIISGVFSTMITIPEMANVIVNFSIDLMNAVSHLQDDFDIKEPVNLYCCVHMGSLYLADVTKNSLQIFDLYGFQMNVSEIVMLKYPPNQVIITDSIYDVISTEEFDITYFSYISKSNGIKYKLYSVEKHISVL